MKNKLKIIIIVVIGLSIMILTPVLLFYFTFIAEPGIYDSAHAQQTRTTQLPRTIKAIEEYKLEFGKYPDTLYELGVANNDHSLGVDFIQTLDMLKTSTKNVQYYYENKGDFYYLFSRGLDGTPFTEDDVFPEFDYDTTNIGYRKA